MNTFALADVVRATGAKKAGNGYLGRCPAHDDVHPSLSIAEGDNRALLLNCHAGCGYPEIKAALEAQAGMRMPATERTASSLQFVARYDYYDASGTLVAWKERWINEFGAKTFKARRPDPANRSRYIADWKGVNVPLYRLPELIGAPVDDPVVIVEGERDADRLASLGLIATTTPGGAKAPWRAKDAEYFRRRRVCVIGDDDRKPGSNEAGQKKMHSTANGIRGVAAEVSELLLPNPHDIHGFDASDFLDSGGTVAELNRLIAESFEDRNALPPEIVRNDQLIEQVVKLWHDGPEPGAFCGWDSLSRFYRPRLGELTVVTGPPNAGKSTFLDDLMVRMALGDASPMGRTSPRWRFIVFSPEQSSPARHMRGLLRQLLGKPFDDGPCVRMSEAEMKAGMRVLLEHFVMIDPRATGCTLDRVIAISREMNARQKLQGLVLDPYNIISAQSRSKGDSEHDFVNYLLTQLCQFARREEMHVFIVAHPTKLKHNPGEEYPVPGPYDISASAHWYNQSDAIITVWRAMLDAEKAETGEVDLHVQKVRFQPECGRLGVATLFFDRVTTRYSETPHRSKWIAPWEESAP